LTIKSYVDMMRTVGNKTNPKEVVTYGTTSCWSSGP
jgi:hypothetical protein